MNKGIHRRANIHQKYTDLLEGAVCISGIWIFALCIQRESHMHYFAWAAILLTAIVISRSIHNKVSILSVFGFLQFSRKVFYVSLAGILMGVLLALLNRHYYDDCLVPSGFTWFAIIAPMIGITEELVFRGYVQTKMAAAGSGLAIIVASTGHAVYKYLVIKTLPGTIEVNLAALVLLTFIVGLIFGMMRNYSGNLLPAVLAHAVFDIVVYGGLEEAPAWV